MKLIQRLFYSESLITLTEYTHNFIDGSQHGDKTAATFICHSFEFSKRLPDKASIFPAELEVILYSWRYIRSTVKNNTFVVFSCSKSARQALFSQWDHPMGIVGNEKTDYAANASLEKVVYECLISYTDAYQYISQYKRDSWQRESDTGVNNKLHTTKPLTSSFKLGYIYLTHSYLKGEQPPECVTCNCRLTNSHIVVDCMSSINWY